jgi:hypothetical protein
VATKVTCDVCETTIGEPFLRGTVEVDVQDGPNHHNGDMDYKVVDLCERCFKEGVRLDTKKRKIRRYIRIELSLSDLRKNRKEKDAAFEKEFPCDY